jgi:peptidoglycan/LPS O-acetylase OafA/YrhL
MRRWARFATAGVAVVAGTMMLLAALVSEGLGEEGDPGAPAVIVALGTATIVAGAVTAFVAAARYAAIALLATVFVLAYSGEVADDVVYETIAGVALVLLGLLSITGGRRRRPAPSASAADGASPGAPSEAPSTPGAEPDDRAPRS